MSGSTGPEPGSAEDRAANTSLGDLLGEVTKDLSTLMRQEVELAKAEAKQSASKAGKGAGMFGGAGLAGYMALLFLSLALWVAIGYLIGLAWSGLVVAIIYGIVAFVLYKRGKKEMEQVKGLPKTADSLKKIPETLKKDEGPR
ncbi:phage holin family protein [Planctomonas psychrotolerans]|uniref:phage holin family protein n=1 Tax=Planctomonas psychrotolerans TaxID=2528712 RepID=UPI0012399C13|nr:phage holin family protein [Planctomonas psychrotolerans]